MPGKGATPALAAVQPEEADGNGSSIPTTAAHEISSDNGTTWTPCTGPQTDLTPGTYLVRLAATATDLASDPQTIKIEYAPDYQIIEGADSSWKLPDAEEAGGPAAPTDGSLVIKSNGKYSEFLGIKMDGVTVDPSLYTSKSGSTIVTLPASYLNTLTPGPHTITFMFTYGSATTTITATTTVATGDPNSIFLWGGLIVAAAAVAAGTVIYGRRRKQ